jgi:hypothetical protein
LRIAAGHFTASKDGFALDTSSGSFAGLHSPLDFTAHWPQHCISTEPNDCALRFKLAADEFDLDAVNALVNPRAQRRPWYADLIGSPQAKFPAVYALGQVSAAKVTAKSLTLTRFDSKLWLFPGGFALTGITANVFGGAGAGQLTADFSLRAPVYHLTGHIDKTAAANLAALMKDSNASGTANLKFEGEARGWNVDELASTVFGEVDFNWLDGSFNRLSLEAGAKPLHFKSFAGMLTLHDGTFRLSQSKLQSPDGIYSVSGAAFMDKRLELRLTRDAAPSYSIGGTLEHPIVSTIPPATAQAKLVRSGNR